MPMPITWRRPSLARSAIEQAFGRAIDSDFPGVTWTWAGLTKLKFLFDVLSNVDERILFARFSPEQGLAWRRHLAAIEGTVIRWQSGDKERFEIQHLVDAYRLLETCPDEIVPEDVGARLAFLVDPKLRTSIARDVHSLDALVLDEEWKAATVIGGSVVEALLLDRLLQPPNEPRARAEEAKHVSAKDPGWRYAQPLDEWGLAKLITVARDLGVIDKTVASVCEGAKDFRNLIHPGKERAKAPCDKGTALAAAAAVENLVAVFSGTR